MSRKKISFNGVIYTIAYFIICASLNYNVLNGFFFVNFSGDKLSVKYPYIIFVNVKLYLNSNLDQGNNSLAAPINKLL